MYGTFAQLSFKDSLQVEISKFQNSSKEDTEYIDLLLDLGLEQRYFNQDSLKLLSDEGLELSEKINYANGMANAYFGLGTFYSDKGKYDESLNNLQKALEISIKEQDDTLRLIILSNIGTQYDYKGDYDLALGEFLKCLELAEDLDNQEMLSVINENIANLYVTQKDFDEGMFYYEKVKKINEKIGDPVIIAETMSNMASAYAEMGKLELAMFTINSAIKTFEENRITDWLAYAYQVKGKVYLKQQKNKWALYWYAQSELLHGQLDDLREEIQLLTGIAEAQLNLGNDSISKIYAQQAYDFSKKIDAISGIEEGAKLLYKINKNNGDFKKALEFHEIFKEVSGKISRKESQKGLTMLKTKIDYERQKEQLIEENEKALAKQKNYVYTTLIILVIFLFITLLVKRNAKIQKKLNKELIRKQEDLERKEKYLHDVNQTKNKLFSIIGHDLRGPIGAFQGLIKLFKEGEMTKDEFIGFVPKLKSDIDNIAFTLNNLLSWGQTQMNGAMTKPGVTSIESIVNENIALLSEVANNKSIKLINRIEPQTLTWCDSDQIDIVIRNLMSNAIKFTPENGIVTIGAVEKTKQWEIYVRDNGVGMNEETLSKIFNHSGTHSTYGTNDEKGTGLGLSLCKEMVEKNHGIIWVNSAINKGSSFYFTIPKAQKEYKKTA
ncbi:histidine kinase [Maribacter algicola]|uniref:histidine kinase n=1 Tax=Maribacter algicola TaxID=2498892 RepID=A0A426RJ45_9FLAO|nr:ATP-binding protein [Maribacter algicola]RRQ49025.1 histidine kinase [Maribacter algicola]